MQERTRQLAKATPCKAKKPMGEFLDLRRLVQVGAAAENQRHPVSGRFCLEKPIHRWPVMQVMFICVGFCAPRNGVNQ